jgi:hypothetical protein
VIAKISEPRGERVAGLIYYLFGPGRREEHIDPHLIAGWRHPAELEPPPRPDGRRDFCRLCGLLQQPHAAARQQALWLRQQVNPSPGLVPLRFLQEPGFSDQREPGQSSRSMA